MGNELAVIERNEYLVLQDGGDVLEAMSANMDSGESFGEQDLTQVKVPSGGMTQWVIPSIGGDEMVRDLTGIIVYQHKRGVLWPSDDPSDSPPVLVSDDLVTAYRVGEDYGDINPDILEAHKTELGYDWVGLTSENGPYGFGSGKNGRGKRAKEYRKLFLLRTEDVLPLIVSIPPASLNSFRKFLVSLTNARIPYWRAEVTVSLKKEKNAGGQEYGEVQFKLARIVPAELAREIRAKYSWVETFAKRLPTRQTVTEEV